MSRSISFTPIASLRTGLTMFALVISLAAHAAAEPSRHEVLAAMKKAATFMVEKVAVHGGYVWLVSDDLSQRWGEIPARPSQIWLQGGTELAGNAFLDAYAATGDGYYLDAARKAADALIFGQHSLGGWHYFIDFDPKGVPDWYATHASRYRYGLEEYRHFYGNATYDDKVTADAAAFVLRFYAVTHEPAYREAVLKSLDFVLMSQYPNGAWPQRFPLRHEFSHDGLPDYTSFFTLNDGATEAIIDLLIEAYETLGDARYFEAARRGVDALIALQGPEGQACWAEQYGPDMRPATGRTHEPAGYVVRESIGVIRQLQEFYLRTGDARYLAPVPRCLAWFERINREAAAQKYPTPRYWEPGTNRPLYVPRTGELTAEGYGKYLWTTDPSKTRCDNRPCPWPGKPIVDVARLRANYDAIAALVTPATRAARLSADRARETRPRKSEQSVGEIVASLDARGAWVITGLSAPQLGGDFNGEERVSVRGISTGEFARRIASLSAYLRDTGN